MFEVILYTNNMKTWYHLQDTQCVILISIHIDKSLQDESNFSQIACYIVKDWMPGFQYIGATLKP